MISSFGLLALIWKKTSSTKIHKTIRSITCFSYILMILSDRQNKMADYYKIDHFVLMISLDRQKLEKKVINLNMIKLCPMYHFFIRLTIPIYSFAGANHNAKQKIAPVDQMKSPMYWCIQWQLLHSVVKTQTNEEEKTLILIQVHEFHSVLENNVNTNLST